MTAPAKPDPALVEKLAMANRILYNQGVVDGFGHISGQHDKSPDHFLLSRNRTPALVRAEDILCLGMNGDLVEPFEHRSYLERFIHSEIDKARPDVMSVVRSHSQSVIPFGATGQHCGRFFT